MKKNIQTIGCILISSIMLSGCNDFLKEDSGDLLIPGTVDEFSPMLYAEGYPSSFNDDVNWFVLMTDDVEMGQLETDENDDDSMSEKMWDVFDSYKGGDGYEAYSWRQKIGLPDQFWANRYKNILACNTVIDALPSMDAEGNVSKYNYLAAQAYALRAYNYWCLINTYALPWSEDNLAKPGVILRLTPQIDTAPKARATIGDIYRQINEDIALAEKYIAESYVPGNKHLLTAPAIYMLATRIALFQEKWDEVLRLGELFSGKNGYYIYDLKNVNESTLGTDDRDDAFHIMNGKINNEILFTFGSPSTYLFTYAYLANHISQRYGLGFRPSHIGDNSLIESYENGDLRRKVWFAKDKEAVVPEYWWDPATPKVCCYDYPVKYRRTQDNDAQTPSEKNYHENWRSVEVLLNVAEAMVRKNNSISAEAIALLNTLRKNRFDNSYTDLTTGDFTSSDELIKFIWAERRRELCFEEAMRLWDLKRQGMPEINHRWHGTWDTYETYTLPQGSPNYVLSIPDVELDYNNGCVNNSRDIITAK